VTVMPVGHRRRDGRQRVTDDGQDAQEQRREDQNHWKNHESDGHFPHPLLVSCLFLACSLALHPDRCFRRLLIGP
jgi:hypothetical protein